MIVIDKECDLQGLMDLSLSVGKIFEDLEKYINNPDYLEKVRVYVEINENPFKVMFSITEIEG